MSLQTGNKIKVTRELVDFIGKNYIDQNDNQVYFSNNYNGIEFSFKGTMLMASIKSTGISDQYQPFIKVYLDNKEPYDIRITELSSSVIIADGLEDKKHFCRILKRSEANCNALSITELETSVGGVFFEKQEKKLKRKIEVLGDSIICGFGNIYNEGDPLDSITLYEDGTQVYGAMIAESFGADIRSTALSGVGVARNAGDQKGSGGALGIFVAEDMRGSEKNDFSYKPDILIISLGTNDESAEKDEMKEAVKRLLKTARDGYPDTYIIWSYGLMSHTQDEAISEAINELVLAGDDRLYYFLHDTYKESEGGAGLYGHPKVATHKRAAAELSEFISDITGWK